MGKQTDKEKKLNKMTMKATSKFYTHNRMKPKERSNKNRNAVDPDLLFAVIFILPPSISLICESALKKNNIVWLAFAFKSLSICSPDHSYFKLCVKLTL